MTETSLTPSWVNCRLTLLHIFKPGSQYMSQNSYVITISGDYSSQKDESVPTAVLTN